MEDPVADAILNQYFRRLEQALSGLPAERRSQIVEDLRTHVQECLQAESDHSDATILAILDRVGDPDEIAREALADDAMPGPAGPPATSHSAATRSWPGAFWKRRRLTASGLLLLVVAVAVVIGLTAGGSPAARPNGSRPAVHGRLVAAHTDPSGSARGGWLPGSDVSGDHQSPGASDCSPQTTSGSGSASALEAGATKVASGSVDGHAWSLWSKNGQSGANGLETGGIVVDGVAHGLCPGFANPGEMELLEPSGGGDGIAYGVVGYPGAAKVAIYRDTFGNFATTQLVGSTTAQKVNGVGFFITSLSQSACDVPGVEMNTASSSYATEHNLAFATSDCKSGQLVPISDSQGIWALPTSGFPNKFQTASGGGSGQGSGGGGGAATLNKNGWLPAADVSGGGGVDDDKCAPQTLSGSDAATTLEADATEVASGTTAGHRWSVWSKKGQSGATGLEDGGVVVDGVAHGMCPGFPNPSETEMLEPSGGGDGLAYGVIGYPGIAKVAIYQGTVESFDTGQLLASTTAQKVNGVGFYITPLSASGCDVSSLEVNIASASYASEHNLGFSDKDCSDGQLVPISWSQGIWQLPISGFPNKFQSARGGGAPSAPSPSRGGWLPGSDVSGDHQSPGASDCSPQTTSGSGSASALEAGATKVASGSVDGHAWSLWSKNGQSGANGLETGGIVVDGVAHGLCPGFANPGEMELLEPSGGGDGIAYGVVGYPGAAKVAIYRDTFGNFATTQLVGSTTAQKVNGVGFFITSLSQSACDVPGVEMNTASSSYATEHNLAFATSDCKSGQLVPISDSQGIWALPTSGFPNKFQTASGGGSGQGSGAGPLSPTGPDFSSCSPRTDEATSGTAESSVADASEVASGTINGHSWSLWSKHGEHGSAALEDAGVILDGHSYGICPGVRNPAEFELIDPSSGGRAIVIGVSGYDGAASIKLSKGIPDSFKPAALLYSGRTVSADGTGFFIAQLPKSACDYDWLELNVTAGQAHSQHLLGFGSCSAGKPSPITGGQGAWSASR